MSLSYCGTPLPILSAAQTDGLNIDLDPRFIWEWAERTWPASGLAFAGFRGALPRQHARVGSLYWPGGASRFAVGHYVASEPQLAQIRTWLDGPGEGVGDLAIDDGANTITASAMAMLPARPIYRVVSATFNAPSPSGLYLLTLVDQRFFWWFSYAQGIEGDSWPTLYSDVASALGVEIAVDEIPAAYADPPAGLLSPSTSIPLLLDSIACLCGQKIVCQLDGTVQAINASTGASRFLSNIALAARLTGDVFDMAGGSGADLTRGLPASATVVFGQGAGETALTIPLADVTLPPAAGATGYPGTKVLRSVFLGDAPDRQSLANQWAQDWYTWEAYGVDAVYSGAVAWDMDGVAELLEFIADDARVALRAQRGPWIDHVPEMCPMQSGPAGPPDINACHQIGTDVESWYAAGMVTDANQHILVTFSDIGDTQDVYFQEDASFQWPYGNVLEAVPFWVGYGGIIDGAGFLVATAGAVNAKARMAIYSAGNPFAGDMSPACLLWDSGDVDVSRTLLHAPKGAGGIGK